MEEMITIDRILSGPVTTQKGVKSLVVEAGGEPITWASLGYRIDQIVDHFKFSDKLYTVQLET